MRVLIVGCGYIGLPLAAELARQGHVVFGLRRRTNTDAELKGLGIEPLCADITSPETLKSLPADFDWVVNCTASGGGDVADYRRIYREGNRHLLQWLDHARLKKFVYTSSTSVYGQNDGSLVTEKSPTSPVAETAGVLLEAEDLLLAAAAKGFPAAVLRLAGIYGPQRGHWFKQFLRGEARIEGDGSRHLNMIHRDDAVLAIIAALEHGQGGQVYNVVDEAPVTQLEFFQWLAAQFGKPLPPSIPADPNVWRRRGVTNKRVGNARLKTELGYQFRFPNFRAGYAPEVQRQLESGE
jgi:nucleoside-diphosphate-sugar epimerase